MKKIGIYVHIPFCMKKCFYCDFVSYCNKENLVDEYIECLKKEIESKKNKSKRNSAFLQNEYLIHNVRLL